MNQQKINPFLLGALIVAIGVGTAYISNNQKRPLPPSGNSQNTQTQTTTTGTQKSGTTTQKIKTYTLADVAKHNSPSDCWTAINGSVYNVTAWIPEHPGGEQNIINLCGIDGSDTYNGQHGGQGRPANELAMFKIGVLAQ